MGMDTSGSIYLLREGEKPKVGDFRIDEREKAALEQLEAFKRADALREMRRLADYPGGSKSAKRRQRKLAAKSRARNRR